MPINEAVEEFMFFIEKIVKNDITAHLDEMCER